MNGRKKERDYEVVNIKRNSLVEYTQAHTRQEMVRKEREMKKKRKRGHTN
jgi:hypothetical protein